MFTNTINGSKPELPDVEESVLSEKHSVLPGEACLHAINIRPLFNVA